MGPCSGPSPSVIDGKMMSRVLLSHKVANRKTSKIRMEHPCNFHTPREGTPARGTWEAEAGQAGGRGAGPQAQVQGAAKPPHAGAPAGRPSASPRLVGHHPALVLHPGLRGSAWRYFWLSPLREGLLLALSSQRPGVLLKPRTDATPPPERSTALSRGNCPRADLALFPQLCSQVEALVTKGLVRFCVL